MGQRQSEIIKNHMEVYWHDYASASKGVPITEAGLVEKASVIGRTGLMLLECGTGAWRVRSSMNTLSPVSYTHLDVYKRQEYQQALLRRGEHPFQRQTAEIKKHRRERQRKPGRQPVDDAGQQQRRHQRRRHRCRRTQDGPRCCLLYTSCLQDLLRRRKPEVREQQ